MDNNTELLNQLRDIHLPPPISNWPWATGRYVLIGLGFIILISIAFLSWRWWQRQQWKKKLVKHVSTLQLENNFAGLSALLKRVALRAYPHENVAGLHNQAWLVFLDRTNVKNTTEKFQSLVGELLLDLPYRKSVSNIAIERQEKLFKLAKNWILKNYKIKKIS